MIDIARGNFEYLGLSKRVELYCCDARKFIKLDEYNYFFFYNPFPRIVMETVLDNIKESYKRNKRKITLIYENPVDGDLFEQCDWLVHIKDYKYDICAQPIRVFATNLEEYS